jgi:hypothetical protein
MNEFGGIGTCRGRGAAYGVQVVSIGGYRGSAFMEVEAAGTAAVVTLRTLARGRYRYRLWLSDSPEDPRESLPPANVDALHWDGITDEEGTATVRVEYDAPRRTYYPWVELVPVTCGSGIEMGTI